MTIYFTSDSHFFHNNIVEFEPHTRGHFNSIEDMNTALIKAWNSVVTEDDQVYHLGDFGMNIKYPQWVELLSQLNGSIKLIQGNHDGSKVVKKLANEGLIELYEVGHKMKVNKQIMWLTHYPMEIGLRPRKWSVSGHIHSVSSRYKNQINVGVDSPLEIVRNKPFGTPISLDEIIEYMDKLIPEIEEEYEELRGES